MVSLSFTASGWQVDHRPTSFFAHDHLLVVGRDSKVEFTQFFFFFLLRLNTLALVSITELIVVHLPVNAMHIGVVPCFDGGDAVSMPSKSMDTAVVAASLAGVSVFLPLAASALGASALDGAAIFTLSFSKAKGEGVSFERMAKYTAAHVSVGVVPLDVAVCWVEVAVETKAMYLPSFRKARPGPNH